MKTNELELIAGQIASGYRDGAWPNVSVRNLLHAMSAAEAAAHPIVGAHSAWEIALHLGFWHRAVRQRLAGQAVEYEPEEDWPAPAAPTEANWKAALDEVDRGLAALVDVVRRLAPDRLAEIVPGRTFTVYFMLHGMPQHDLYHAGQVMFLTKALRAGQA
jgi:hypothetical protein